MSELKIAVHYGRKKNRDGSYSSQDKTYIRGINFDIGDKIREFGERHNGFFGYLTLTLDANAPKEECMRVAPEKVRYRIQMDEKGKTSKNNLDNQ